MGLKFTRDYEKIIEELSVELAKINDFYDFFQMSKIDWSNLSEDEKAECARTLADDVFYTLGQEGELQIAGGVLKYNKKNNNIEVIIDENIISAVKL